MAACRSECANRPHLAAVNDKPWRRFLSYGAARAYVARFIRRPTDKAWVRCVEHFPLTEQTP